MFLIFTTFTLGSRVKEWILERVQWAFTPFSCSKRQSIWIALQASLFYFSLSSSSSAKTLTEGLTSRHALTLHSNTNTMSAAKLTSCLAAATAAVAASISSQSNPAYSESFFRFPFFSSSPSPTDQSSDNKSDSPPPEEEPSKSGFDPESLERAAKALREINNSPHAKKVF